MPKRPSEAYQSPYADQPSIPLASNLTPLAIILDTMRRRYAEGDLDGAVALARIAAPYLHPRIPAATPPTDLAAMPDADLDAFRPQD
ncbi:hypothetical protein [Acidisphaera sp. L21]|uniref:hypothetical protein n=1 Tax=Acidisphaera sp. L21 TaxID=1641851 RepID=UPI00131D399F|nr:hypothetical protein [Acidisphaera sp. L21]